MKEIVFSLICFCFLCHANICHAKPLGIIDKASFEFKLKELAYKISKNSLHDSIEQYSNIEICNLQSKLSKLISNNSQYCNEFESFINKHVNISWCYPQIIKIISEKHKFEKIENNIETINKNQFLIPLKNKGLNIFNDNCVFYRTSINVNYYHEIFEPATKTNDSIDDDPYIQKELSALENMYNNLKSCTTTQEIKNYSQLVMNHVKNIFNYKDLSELNIEYILPYWKTAKICFDYSVTPKMIAQNYENYEKYFFYAQKELISKLINSNNMYFIAINTFYLAIRFNNFAIESSDAFDYLSFVKKLPSYETLRNIYKIQIILKISNIAFIIPDYNKTALAYLDEVLSMISLNQEQYSARKVIHLRAKIIFDYISRLYEKSGNINKAIDELKNVVKLARDCPKNPGTCVGYSESCKGICTLGQEANTRLKELEASIINNIEIQFAGATVEPIYVNESNIYKGTLILKKMPDNVSNINAELCFTHNYDKNDDIILETNKIKNRRLLEIVTDTSGSDIKLEPGFVVNNSTEKKFSTKFSDNNTICNFEFKCNYFNGDIFELTATITLNGKKIQCAKKLQVWKRYSIEHYYFPEANDLTAELKKLKNIFDELFIKFEVTKSQPLNLPYKTLLISSNASNIDEISIKSLIKSLKNDHNISFDRNNKINFFGITLIDENGLPNVHGFSFNNLQEFNTEYPNLDIFSSFIAVKFLQQNKYSQKKCILHELGHSFGLKHHDIAGNVSTCCMMQGNDPTWNGIECYCLSCKTIIKNSYLFIYSKQLTKRSN